MLAWIGYVWSNCVSYVDRLLDSAYESNCGMAVFSCIMALVFIVHVKSAAVILASLGQANRSSQVNSFTSSPIDIALWSVCRVEQPLALQWSCYEELPPAILLENNGRSVIMRFSCAPDCTPYISGGQLPGNYYFVEATFKWGSSEHLIDSRAYALELQVLHATNLQNAPHEYLTISYLFALTRRKNKQLDQVVENLKAIRQAGSIIELPPFDLASLLFRFGCDYYSYPGSYANGNIVLPTLWFICTHIFHIGDDQLNQFTALCDRRGCRIPRNSRHIQPLGSRRVALNC